MMMMMMMMMMDDGKGKWEAKQQHDQYYLGSIHFFFCCVW